VLDRTAEIEAQKAQADRQDAERPSADVAQPPTRHFDAIRRLAGSAWHFFVAQSFSSLTRRIVSLNLAGLIALVASILYLSQFRAGLIDARAQSLLVQGEIIAGAIAASAISRIGEPPSDQSECVWRSPRSLALSSAPPSATGRPAVASSRRR